MLYRYFGTIADRLTQPAFCPWALFERYRIDELAITTATGQTTETAGFSNTVGFYNDTRAFLSVPARHDVARRTIGLLASLVADRRLDDWESAELPADLAYGFAKKADRL